MYTPLAIASQTRESTPVHQAILPWLDMLRQLCPPRALLLVGAGNASSPWVQYLMTTGHRNVTLIEADESTANRLKIATQEHPDWTVKAHVIASDSAPAAFYTASLQTESGLLEPESLRSLWPNLKTTHKQTRQAITLAELQEDAETPANWLLVDCLPALPILQGAAQQLGAFDVIALRVVLNDNALPGSALGVASANELETALQALGFRCLALETSRHPAISQALFVRDTAAQVRQLQQQLAEQAAARDAEKKAYAQENIDLLKARQECLEHECAWLAHRCIISEDLHQSVQIVLAGGKLTDKNIFNFLLELSDQIAKSGDKATALSYLNQCRKIRTADTAESLTAIAKRLINLGQTTEAESVFIQAALDGTGVLPLSEKERAALKNASQKLHQLAEQKTEHGHDLLLSAFSKYLSAITANISGRKPVLIEIGTTREDVPRQGSTRKLADYCKINEIDFITVDMDPHNIEMAKQTFAAMDAPGFQAIASKGEEYLRNYDGPLDFVFLDAYDFDHGKHSELRQSRYEKFLGSRIDELECHRMHLDCAQSVAKKLSPFGLVCFDDTWLEDGKWRAKGTLGMPFLLANGFELVEARNHAALLRRKPNIAESTPT